MSGIRGIASKGKMKVLVCLRVVGTKRKFRSNLFIQQGTIEQQSNAIRARITAKYGTGVAVHTVRFTKPGYHSTLVA